MSAIQLVPNAFQEKAWVLCADCGTAIEPNSAGLCVACLRNSIDITETIPKQASLNFCRNCERYLSPPTQWLPAELESRELLAICLRKLKGLKEVRLVDAGFVWTEPHSKRIRVKLTVQKEVLASTVLQQIFEVEFVVLYGQCPDCTRLAAKNTWRALVQVRQKVDHKRTFLYLEQLILKHGADKDTVSIKEVRDGLDFFYATRQHANKMVDFLNAVAPVKSKTSEQLISLDIQNSTTNYKSTYSIEIVPICKDDLICLPRKLAASHSNIAQIVLCHRVGNAVHLLDPVSLQTVELPSAIYWRNPFPVLASASSTAIEFIVLDIEPTQHPPKTSHKGRYMLADAQVSPVSGSMDNDTIYHTRTHLGAILKPGDTVLGFHLTSSNFNNDAWDEMNNSGRDVPEVVLVKKTYPARQKTRKRKWKLKSIVKEVGESDHAGLGREKVGKTANRAPGGNAEQAKAEAQYEMFLRDLEEDEEMRAGINIFKASSRRVDPHRMEVESDAGESTDVEDDDMPRIHEDELIDEMATLTIEEEPEPTEDA